MKIAMHLSPEELEIINQMRQNKVKKEKACINIKDEEIINVSETVKFNDSIMFDEHSEE